MNYLKIAVVLLLAYLLGQYSVERFTEEKSSQKGNKPSHQKRKQPKTVYLQPQEIEYKTNNVTNIEENVVNQFHFPLNSEDKTHSKEILEKIVKETRQVNTFQSTSKSISYNIPHTNTANSTETEDKILFKKNLITFQSIGTKLFENKDLTLPGIYSFFHLNLAEKPISLKWIVSYKGNTITRTVNYSATKNGNNRAIIFIDRKKLSKSTDDDKVFLSKLKVQLSFILRGKEITFQDARIGNFESVNGQIETRPDILKTRLETKVDLSDSYNPIVK